MANSITHIAPFTIEEFGLQTPPYLTIGIVDGGNSATFTLASGSFFTFMNAGTIEQINYTSFLQNFVDFLAANGFGTWTYSYDFVTSIITLEGGSNTAKFTFDDTSKKILGMESSGFEKPTYTSTVQPWYIWKSTLGDWQNLSYPYEATTVVREKECDDGRVAQTSNEDNMSWLSNKPLNITFQDWEHHAEPRTNIYNNFSSSLNSYTYQQHLFHVRSTKPFAVFQGCTGSSTLYSDRQGTYKIRADKSMFKPVVYNKNLESHWNISLDTRRLSLGTNFGTYNPETATELFNPTSVSNCLIWLDATVGTSFDFTNGFIWKDQSGNGYDFINQDPSQSPSLISSLNTMNNQPIVSFAIDQFLTTDHAVNFQSASAATIFTAFNFNTIPSFGYMFTTQGVSDQIQHLISGSKSYASYNSGSGPITYWTGSVQYVTNSAYVSSFVYQTYHSGTYFSGSMRLNGAALAGGYNPNQGTPAGLITSTDGCAMGIGVRVSELIVYNRELLDSEINDVETYLLGKYGI